MALDPLTDLDARLDIFAKRGTWRATHNYFDCGCCGTIALYDDEGELAYLSFSFNTVAQVEARAARMVAAQRLNELTEAERVAINAWGWHDRRETPVQYE